MLCFIGAKHTQFCFYFSCCCYSSLPPPPHSLHHFINKHSYMHTHIACTHLRFYSAPHQKQQPKRFMNIFHWVVIIKSNKNFQIKTRKIILCKLFSQFFFYKKLREQKNMEINCEKQLKMKNHKKIRGNTATTTTK